MIRFEYGGVPIQCDSADELRDVLDGKVRRSPAKPKVRRKKVAAPKKKRRKARSGAHYVAQSKMWDDAREEAKTTGKPVRQIFNRLAKAAKKAK